VLTYGVPWSQLAGKQFGGFMAKLPKKPKLCFVIGPIGDDDSDDRTHADWLLEEIIEPVFDEDYPEFRVERADKISDPGRIDAQVITALLDADLVVADLSTLNPNAFYEIGIRHTIQKPIIHMHLEGQRIPFDIASFRSIKFSRRRPSDIRAARETLKVVVAAVLAEGYEVDNPVTFSRGKIEFEKTATPSDKVVVGELDSIQRRISTIEKLFAVSPQRVTGFFGSEQRLISFGGQVSLAVAFETGTTSKKISDFFASEGLNVYPSLYGVTYQTERAVLLLDADDAGSGSIERLIRSAAAAGLTITSVMFVDGGSGKK
jgi:hypothetical protein